MWSGFFPLYKRPRLLDNLDFRVLVCRYRNTLRKECISLHLVEIYPLPIIKPGGGHSNPLQYSCLENPMDRGAWRTTVHGVARVGHDLLTISTYFNQMTQQCRRHRRHKLDPWVGKIPWRRKSRPTPVFLPGEFHGQRSLAVYSPWGRKESDS